MSVPETVKTATLQLPTVVTVLVPGETATVSELGTLIATRPDPPLPPVHVTGGPEPPPPPPPPPPLFVAPGVPLLFTAPPAPPELHGLPAPAG